MTSSASPPDGATGSTPEGIHNPGPFRIEDMPDLLQLRALDQLAGIYDEMCVAPTYVTDSGPDFDAIESQIALVKDKLLKDAGFIVEEAGRTQEQADAYRFACNILDKAIRTSRSEWIGVTNPDQSRTSVRNDVFRELLARYYKPPLTIESEPPLPIEDEEPMSETDKRLAELDAIRDRYSKKLAERSKKMGLFERPRTIAEMQAVREEMADYISGVATEMMDAFEAEGVSKVVWVDKIDAFIDAEMAAMVGGMENARANAFRQRNRVVQFGLEKWASWATPTVERREGESQLHHIGRSVLNSVTNWNSLKNNFKKAGVFAVLGGAVGAASVPLFGLLGGGVLIAGGAALLSRQIARGLVGAKLDSLAGAETIAYQQAEDITGRMAELSEGTHYDMLQLAESMAEGYRKHNRNRLLGGMAISLAAGATVGGLIHQFVDFNLLFGKMGEMLQSVFNKHASVNQMPVPESPRPTQWPQGSETTPPPSETPPTSGGEGGKTRGEAISDYIREHAAAKKIDNGEGWDQTLKELGVKRSEWRELLQKVGPKLHKVEYGDVRAAYWDGENNEWRINMTDNHKMSPEALKIIIEEADKQHALKQPLEFSTDPAGQTPEVGMETGGGVKLWHGAAPEQVLQRTYPGLTGRQAYIDINELYDKLGPKNVFERITLSEHGTHNIWIDQDAGTATLTPEAQTLWDQMHPEEKALSQIIAEGRGSSVNIVTNGEHWTGVIDKLKQAGVTDIGKGRYHSILRQLWPQVKGLEYSNGAPVASLDRHGNMILNESPTKVLHPEALRRLVRLLYKNNYRLAA